MLSNLSSKPHLLLKMGKLKFMCDPFNFTNTYHFMLGIIQFISLSAAFSILGHVQTILSNYTLLIHRTVLGSFYSQQQKTLLSCFSQVDTPWCVSSSSSHHFQNKLVYVIPFMPTCRLVFSCCLAFFCLLRSFKGDEVTQGSSDLFMF